MRPATARERQAGYSLIYAVVLMTALSLLAAAILSFSATTSLLQARGTELTLGIEAADAAVEFGIDRVIEDAAAANFAETKRLFVPGTFQGDVLDLTVTNVSITSLTISPSSATVAVNTPATFTATAVSGGVNVSFAPVWTLTCGQGITATLTQAGKFVATAGAGTCTVEVRMNNVSASATVTVQ